MASIRTLSFHLCNLVNIRPLSRLQLFNCEKYYSVYNPTYIKPVVSKDVQKEMEANGETQVISHLPIKPAFSSESSSEFYDPKISKFINYLTREGNKRRGRDLVEKTLENIKRIQVERYNKSTPEVQDKIELDPKVILHNAIENATPVMELLKVKKGGQNYQVPVPLTTKRSSFLAMNWLIRACEDKPRTIRLPERLAHEVIDAHYNQGRVIKKKQELYRQCEANRSYAHFRWN